MSRTLAMVKPEAFTHSGEIVRIINLHGFTIRVSRFIEITPAMASLFYREHGQRTFFPELVAYMSSGPTLVMVLEMASDAVGQWRQLIGATDPQKADVGSIRRRFWNGLPLPQNVVHGSDSPEAAEREIAFFFPGNELM